MTVIIADAGPIIALSRIDKLNLLRQVFHDVTITTLVCDEVLDNDHVKGKSAVIQAIDAGWLTVHAIDMMDWQTLNTGIDAGEASAIFLALHSSDETLLIIDDQAGRSEAKYHKVTIIGTAAVIGIAKSQGYITSARDILYALREAGYYIADTIIDVVLQDVGE